MRLDADHDAGRVDVQAPVAPELHRVSDLEFRLSLSLSLSLSVCVRLRATEAAVLHRHLHHVASFIGLRELGRDRLQFHIGHIIGRRALHATGGSVLHVH